MPRYPNVPGARDSDPDSSHAAADSMIVAAPKLRDMIYNILKPLGKHGATCFELEAIMQMSHQTVSPRLSEMRHKAHIADSGERRLSPSGVKVIVWVAIEFASPRIQSETFQNALAAPDDDYE